MMVNTDIKQANSKYLHGYSRENIKCEEFPICAEAKKDFETFDKYCISDNCVTCPHKILTGTIEILNEMELM